MHHIELILSKPSLISRLSLSQGKRLVYSLYTQGKTQGKRLVYSLFNLKI